MEMLTIHTVKRTDRLETLSAQYQVPVCMIMRANGFKTVQDFTNCRRLSIPRRCLCNRCDTESKLDWLVYTVQSGDTLSDIALRHGVTVHLLNRMNGLAETDSLREGETLSIPVIKGQVYHVREGETLRSIAQAHNITERRICRLNGLKAGESIHAGMKLVIC